MVKIDPLITGPEDIGLGIEEIHPGAIHTFLLWRKHLSDEGTLDSLINRPYANFKFLKFVPPRDSKEVYEPLGLNKPDLEVVLRSSDLRLPVNPEISSKMYSVINDRLDFGVAYYTFYSDGQINLVKVSPDLQSHKL